MTIRILNRLTFQMSYTITDFDPIEGNVPSGIVVTSFTDNGCPIELDAVLRHFPGNHDPQDVLDQILSVVDRLPY